MPEPFTALVMAAGRGTRMRSSLPKMLHPVCARPMVEWVIDAARSAGAQRVVCVTRPDDGVAEGLPDGVDVAEQREGEGTGAAVLAGRATIDGEGTVIVLSGDTPLVSSELIAAVMQTHTSEQATATLLTTEKLDPAGYGRIVRTGDGAVERIVETKHTEDVSSRELEIEEINVGLYAFEADALWSALDTVGREHGETYLTGVLPVMRDAHQRVVAHLTADASSAVGVNDRADLMEAERLAQRRILREHARAGVSFLAPDCVRVEAGVEIGSETVVGAGVTLGGRTRIGERCTIGPQTTITDSQLADDVSVVHSFLLGVRMDDGSSAGPFAYLRPDAHVGPKAKVGTFVEVKNSELGEGAKVPHLSYIGDADVGAGANVAAGNITANYDGFKKHRTQIGEQARTGVHTSFVAPVSVGEGAYIGAGSVIVNDVPAGALGVSRAMQRNIEGYAERVERERG